jgi:hypothetical protein
MSHIFLPATYRTLLIGQAGQKLRLIFGEFSHNENWRKQSNVGLKPSFGYVDKPGNE